MKMNILGRSVIISLIFLLYGCTVKKAGKISIICNHNTIDTLFIKQLIDIKVSIVEVFYISSEKDKILTTDKIDHWYYNNFWDIFICKKQAIPLDTSAKTPKITYSDGHYNLQLNGKIYETDAIVWALPLDSLKQNLIDPIDLKKLKYSMIHFDYSQNIVDSTAMLKGVYFLKESKNKEGNNYKKIITSLISHHEH